MARKDQLQKLSDLFKLYEQSREVKLNFTEPFIVRIRQQSYTQFCEGLNKPYDDIYLNVMEKVAAKMVKNRSIGGCNLGYITHNEINLIYKGGNPKDYDVLLHSFTTTHLTSWISSMVTNYFNEALLEEIKNHNLENSYIYESKLFKAEFKVDAFSIPKDCIYDYLWCKCWNSIRNSTMALALKEFTKEEMTGKSAIELEEILLNTKGIDAQKDLPHRERYGELCYKYRENGKSFINYIALDKPLSESHIVKEPSKNKRNILKLVEGYYVENLDEVK